MSLLDFVILDVETTGYRTTEDRVVEIAVLRVDQDGNTVDQYTTVVNPQRAVLDSVDIHGLSDEYVQTAPEFGQVAGDVLRLMHGAILVGHNVSFDIRFLALELQRIGIDVPSRLPTLCTFSLARKQIRSRDVDDYKLSTLCTHFDIEFSDHHTAAADAAATARLLFCLLGSLRRDWHQLRPRQWGCGGRLGDATAWPTDLPVGGGAGLVR